MLLSRFWYLALAALASAALAALFMAQSALNHQYERHLEEQLQRDRYELELVLRSDARTRIDAISGLAAHPDVRAVLRSSTGREVGGDGREALARTLGSLNSQLRGFAGDLVFAVNDRGRIVASLGAGDAAPAGSGLGGFPLVERALAGYLRDDVWVWNERVYRMAARPVVDQGRYIGAVIHGMEVDGDFAQQLARSLPGATIAFFVRDRVIGSHMPGTEGAARAQDLVPSLATALQDEALLGGGRTEPALVADGTARAVYSLVTGGAAAAQVGYAIARPRTQLEGLGGLFGLMDFDRDLGTTNLLMLVGLAIVAFLIGMGFMFLERDRPIANLQQSARQLAEGRRDRFDVARFRGKYRALAQATNEALQRTFESAGAASRTRTPADLDDILGPTPDSGDGPSFFGFAGSNGAAGASNAIPTAPPPAGAVGGGAPAKSEPRVPSFPGFDSSAGDVGSGSLPSNGAGSTPTRSDPDATPSAELGGDRGAAPVEAPKVPPPPPPPPGLPQKPAWAKGTLVGVGSPTAATPPLQRDDKPENVFAPPPPTTDRAADDSSNGDGTRPSHPSDFPPLGDEDDEGQTIITNVPQELIDAAAESEASAEEAHFRDVFDQFLQTKRDCGEGTSSLNFDRFRQTLQKNRDAILSKHDAKSVRFSVYVKQGKAALKATPVR